MPSASVDTATLTFTGSGAEFVDPRATTLSTLCAEVVAITDGVPLGYGIWRFVVQAAVTSEGAPLGAFILGTSKLGGARWLDITDHVEGIQFTRGGNPGSGPIAGEMNLRLRNQNRQFSPYQSSYYAPGTLVRVVVGDGNQTIPVFTGLSQSWNESSSGVGRYHWCDIVVWETMYLLGLVDDPALLSAVGATETVFDRVDRILDAAEWQFGATYVGTADSVWFPLQGTVFAGDLLTELYKTVESLDYQAIPGKNGSIQIRARETSWINTSYRDLGSTVPIVADSLVTENDDLRLLSDVALKRVGDAVPVEYTNSGIAARYQKRSIQKTDLITINPGTNQDLTRVAEGILNRGDLTYRVTSVDLDTKTSDLVWQFVLAADVGQLVNIYDPDSGVDFTGYSISAMQHDITPLKNGIRWTANVKFEIEANSSWNLV